MRSYGVRRLEGLLSADLHGLMSASYSELTAFKSWLRSATDSLRMLIPSRYCSSLGGSLRSGTDGLSRCIQAATRSSRTVSMAILERSLILRFTRSLKNALVVPLGMVFGRCVVGMSAHLGIECTLLFQKARESRGQETAATSETWNLLRFSPYGEVPKGSDISNVYAAYFTSGFRRWRGSVRLIK